METGSSFGDSSGAAKGRSPQRAESNGRIGGRFQTEALGPVSYSASNRNLIQDILDTQAPTIFGARFRDTGTLPWSALQRIDGYEDSDGVWWTRTAGWVPEELATGGGESLWIQNSHNLVVDTGCNDFLDKYLKGSTYTAAHYLGLTDGTPTVAAGDTMASHSGWTEPTNYDEGARQTISWGTVSGKSVDNSASKAVVTASSALTSGGAFVTTNATKGGSAGTLITAVAFTGGDETLGTGETLTITYTITSADDGA